MTKNKKIILIIAAAAVVVFFFVIDTIKGIQTNIERNKNATDAEKFIEKFGSNETYSFREIVSKADFGKFTCLETRTTSISENSPFYNTIFQKGDYYYKDDVLTEKIMEVMDKYKYTYSQYDLSSAENAHFLWGLYFQGFHDIKLVLFTYTTENEDIILMGIHLEDSCYSGVDTNEWFRKHNLGMLVSSELSEELRKVLKENTRKISMEETLQIISENEGEMPLYKMLSYENLLDRHYVDYGNDDDYFIYKQELENSEDYLLTYVMKIVVPELQTSDIYIFKIELYGNDGQLKEVLYDDTERYEMDKMPG